MRCIRFLAALLGWLIAARKHGAADTFLLGCYRPLSLENDLFDQW
ncbi:MAG TPA: hypothetical protein VGR73_14920 [Bryobacteraceae bacterium]|nr:hypothetical protein [Bryobacteraceae bacterium]